MCWSAAPPGRSRPASKRSRGSSSTVQIALVGKYMGVEDSYVSIVEALHHGGIAHRARVEITKVDSEELERLTQEEVDAHLSAFDGIAVCPGFGGRGVEGEGEAIRFARAAGSP